MNDANLPSWSHSSPISPSNPISPNVMYRWLRKLFMADGLGLKLFLAATLVGTNFAFMLGILRLLTEAHLRQVDVTDHYALVRYAYQLSGQVHYDLLGMIIAFYLLVYATTILLYPVLRLHQKALKRQALDNMRARGETLIMLGSLIAKRDSDTSVHNYRVTLYAIHLAGTLRIPEAEMHDLVVGAFLHDIGKIAIPDKILLKPGPLDEEETTIMRTHVAQGLDILRHNVFLRGAEAIVEGHHEHYLGTGYPNGLAGKAIPPIARLFSIADVFDALTSGRPYKQPYSLEESLRLMTEESGKAFDPEYLQSFLSLAPKLYQSYVAAPEEFLASELKNLAGPILVSRWTRDQL
ncbi:MAG: HD-GYP domain-containing protein [Desulfobulbaceae bacterium]|nr:HD-GYP domain-containing protein [Desulfobulbaceae bacterium]